MHVRESFLRAYNYERVAYFDKHFSQTLANDVSLSMWIQAKCFFPLLFVSFFVINVYVVRIYIITACVINLLIYIFIQMRYSK